MYAVFAPTAAIQSRSTSATNSGPLSERMCTGTGPRALLTPRSSEIPVYAIRPSTLHSDALNARVGSGPTRLARLSSSKPQPVLKPVDEQSANVIHVHMSEYNVGHRGEIDAGCLQSIDQLSGSRQM